MNLKSIRNAFISGLVLLAPVGITFYVIKTLVETIGGPTSKLIFFFIPPEIFDQTVLAVILNILATLCVLVCVTLLGWLSKYFLGRFLLRGAEGLLTSVPFVKSVYNTVKQIIDTFSAQKKAVFQKVVLVEFPRKGIFAMGFLTSEGKGEIALKTKRDLWNIFLPTTPNPTSGYLLMVPREEVVELDMTVTDGMKMIISGGAVAPLYNPRIDRLETVAGQIPERIAKVEAVPMGPGPETGD